MMRLIIALLLLSCSCKGQNIRGYKYEVCYPYLEMRQDSLKLIQLRDTLPIFYYKDYVLYFMPYKYLLQNQQHQVVGEETKYSYFVYRKNEQYGYTFDRLNDSSALTRVWVDSFLQKRAFKTSFVMHDHTVTDSSYDAKTKVITEKYAPLKRDEYMFDSAYFYYSKEMNEADFSLSEHLDSLRKNKLFQVRLLYNQYFSKSNNITIPKREFLFRFERYYLFDPKPIIAFLDKFKGD